MSDQSPLDPTPTPPSTPPGEPTAYGPPPGGPTAYPAPPTQPAPPTYASSVPAQPLTPEAEKQVGAAAHGIAAAATFFSGGTLGFIAALIIYLIYRDRGPFVRSQAANALNVQIITGIGLMLSAVLMFVLIGFLTYPIIWVTGIVVHIVGAIKALNGEWWKPPFTYEFVR